MELLPMDMEILPPSDDWVFKRILTAPEAKPVLMDLISALIQRKVADVEVHNNEIAPNDEVMQMAGNVLMGISRQWQSRKKCGNCPENAA